MSIELDNQIGSVFDSTKIENVWPRSVRHFKGTVIVEAGFWKHGRRI